MNIIAAAKHYLGSVWCMVQKQTELLRLNYKLLLTIDRAIIVPCESF